MSTSAAALNSGTVPILRHDFVDEIMHPSYRMLPRTGCTPSDLGEENGL
jgi:hypothetical protein